ncbi:MAG: hypothetical protein IKH10_00775, partial [Bacteroidetes bacterium]|nr:hypothetical protein [Bacteroidota bacterium]
MPRITINEVNSTQSQALDITSANPVAIIGTATKGPINTPIPISSYSEFISVFGTSAPAESEYPYGYFAAKECLYAGNPIVYTRLGDTTSQTGKATDAIYTKANVATCEASTPGIWANNYKVGFTRVGTTGQTYDISVIDTSDVTVATARVTGLDPADELEDDADNVLITLAGITVTQLVNATTVEETTTYHAADLSSLSGTEVTLAGGTDGAITNDNIATI